MATERDGFGLLAASCGGSAGSRGDGGSTGPALSLGAPGSSSGSYGDVPFDPACPGYLPLPEAAPPNDTPACIGITVSGGGFDPCGSRASLPPAVLASRCESDFAKLCSGTRYEVVCACPEGTCACLRTEARQDDGGDGDGGASTSAHVVMIGTCPNCPDQDQALYALCGFPY